MPLGAEQGHTELESGHAPTVSYGDSSRTAASRWTAPSIRVARGSLSQLGRSRYSAGRREVRPQHLPSRADHALQHMLEGGPGLESSPGLMMMMDRSSLRIFFNVVTVSFRVLYVFVIMEIGTRKMLHFNVTAHPTAEWTLQQFREAIECEHDGEAILPIDATLQVAFRDAWAYAYRLNPCRDIIETESQGNGRCRKLVQNYG